jgi:hypothetical protein
MSQQNIIKPNINTKYKLNILVGLMLANVMFTGSDPAFAENKTQIRTIEATAATGWNRRFEKPIHIFNDITDFGFSTIRIRNPDGGRPFPITEDTPHSALLSTYFDPTTRMPVLPFLEGFSLNSDAPALNNAPVVLSRDGTTRTSIRPHLEAGQMEVSHVGSGAGITLGDWLKAKGKLTIKCSDNGENWLHFKMTGLVPDRHYSLWDWYVPTNVPGFPVIPTAAGGIGSDIMTDSKGNANYSVQTNNCFPLSIDDIAPTRGIMAILHWEHQSHGATPIAPLYPNQPRLPGDSAGVQLWWPIAGGGYTF